MRQYGPLGDFAVPKLFLHGIYIPNVCKHFKYFCNHFMGMHEANSNKPLKNIKKISGIERLVLPFLDT